MNIEQMKKNISVVVQGPLDDRSYETIDCYKDFGEIIISTWENENFELLEKADIQQTKVKICSSNPNIPKTASNEGGRYYQAVTTLSGAKIATCPYVMKTRTDELYPDLDAMLYSIIEHPNKSHTTNNGFWKHEPYCYSNHLFIDQTNLIIDAMSKMADACLGSIEFIDINRIYCAESCFGFFLMLARGEHLLTKSWKEVFRKHVHITPCHKLKGHLHSGASIHHRGGFKRSKNYPEGRLEAPRNIHPIEKLYNDSSEF